MSVSKSIKAVGLLSGGLDSILAVRVLQEQDIEITGFHIQTGFSYVARDRALGLERELAAERAADLLEIPLVVVSPDAGYRSVVLNPRFGRGSGMNPCVDCRIFLLRQAKAWMEAHDHHFVFTGEVLGQRPMSQMRDQMRTVERESGLEGLLLRPLSAKLLEPTIPEKRGWVDRDSLLGLSGRGRKEQIALAKKYGISDYPQPSGGCCTLIDQNYARRLEDLLTHEGGGALTEARTHVLAVGRHFRLDSGQKVVIGRNERENDFLAKCGVDGVRIRTVDVPGPLTLLPGRPSPTDVEQAARMTAGYSDGRDQPEVLVEVQAPNGSSETRSVAPMAIDDAHAWML